MVNLLLLIDYINSSGAQTNILVRKSVPNPKEAGSDVLVEARRIPQNRTCESQFRKKNEITGKVTPSQLHSLLTPSSVVINVAKQTALPKPKPLISKKRH